jgi:hypothetical protein
VAEFTVSPDPCTITGSRAAVDCVVNGERSDSIQPIVSYVWTVGGVTSGNNMRLLLPLTCVYYPVGVLPVWLQPVAWSLPPT